MAQDRTLAPPHEVPAAVRRLAANADLGRLLHVYKPKRTNLFLLIPMLILVLASVVILVGLWLLWAMSRTPNLSKSLAARRLYLYEQGFVFLKQPGNLQAYRWDDIDTVFQKIVSQRLYGIEVTKKYLYTITRRDGATVTLDVFWDGIAQLGPHINECVSAALLPRALAALRRGQGVRFGDITLTADGIAGRRKSVAWPEVGGLVISSGYVRVNVQGKSLSLSRTAAADIPNLPLFLALAERLRRPRRTAP